MRIPRLFHQIWVGPNPFPDEYAALQETWRTHNPDWELHFWRDDNLPEGLRQNQIDRLKRVADACPVRRALEAGFAFDERISSPSTERLADVVEPGIG